jgi:hypothetical protein
MLSLYDMLAQAQNGNAFDQMARNFGLSQQQAQAAMEALLPAFSQGLRRNAADPYGVGSFLTALSTGQHAKYFEEAGRAFSPEGMAEGNGILGHIFGSKELSRAVAAQAAQTTGIAQETIKQMLPALAAMIMGGLYKQTTGQVGRSAAAPSNPLFEMMERMMQAGMGAPAPRPEAPQPGFNPFDNPFGKMMEGMFGGGAQGGRPAPAENPFGRMFEEMMNAGRPREPEPEARPRETPSGRQRTTYDDLFGQMFETGRKTREDYERSMGSIFDQYLKGMERRR